MLFMCLFLYLFLLKHAFKHLDSEDKFEQLLTDSHSFPESPLCNAVSLIVRGKCRFTDCKREFVRKCTYLSRLFVDWSYGMQSVSDCAVESACLTDPVGKWMYYGCR